MRIWSNLLLVLTLALPASGCRGDSKPREVPPGPANGSATPAPSKPTYEAIGQRPVNPKRATPPPELLASALPVGAAAPSIELASSTGKPWSLAEAQTKHARTMLVFFRGDW